MPGENEQQIEASTPDDGLNDTERAQFEAMRTGAEQPAETGADAGGEGAAERTTQVADGSAEGAAAAAERAEAASGDDDVDDDPASGQQPDPNAKKSRRVSRSFLERETAARDKTISELRAELNQKTERQAKLEERMTIINEALTPKQQAQQGEEDPEPDREADIFAHNAWLSRKATRLEAAINDLRSGREQETAVATVQRAYEDDAHGFIAREPNFAPGYQFLMASRIGELALYYFDKDVTAEGATLTPQEFKQIRDTIAAEERELVSRALKDGKSPAARIFSLAKARGFRPPAPNGNGDAAAAAAANGKGNGQAQPGGRQNGGAPGNLAAEAAKVDGGQGKPNGQNGASVREEIERVKRGSESALSLSLGGGAPAMTLTPEKIADMPQDEFDALMDQLSPAEVRRAMGG